MVPVQLIGDLAAELRKVLSHMRLPKQKGEESEINIFEFGLPVEKTKEDSNKKFPYVLVIPTEGGDDDEDLQKVSIQLLIGVYDDEQNNQGKKHIMNIINDISERFQKDPSLKYCFANEKITWVVDSENEYPYHYGAIWMSFQLPIFNKESEYA